MRVGDCTDAVCRRTHDDGQGQLTALMGASENGHLAVVNALVAKGAVVNVKTEVRAWAK